MEKFTVYTGKSVPLMNDNIDTDQLIPKQFLKAVDKKGFGKICCLNGAISMIITMKIQILSLTNLNIVMQRFVQGITLVQGHP